MLTLCRHEKCHIPYTRGVRGVQPNQSNRAENMKKILNAFNSIDKLPKAFLKYGVFAFLMLFTIATVFVILNNTILPFNPYYDMISKELVKTSFVIGAEVIIGSLVMDFVFKR